LLNRIASVLALTLLLAGPAVAQDSPGPRPLPMPPAIPEARDVAFPGTMTLSVDATDLDRRIFRVKQTIPVTKAGPMVLLYPEWLPGNHAPRGQLEKIAGLVITAGGKPVKWVRDPVEVYAFHVDVPEGATALDLSFEFLSATAPDQGRVVVTNEMLNLQWNSTAFYPAGWYVSRIPVEASVTLPDGWKFGVALDVASQSGGKTTFKPVSFETLVDSPMFAGRYFRQVELDRGGRSPVMLNIVADRPEQLDINAEQLALHRNLVVQADRLFGPRPFDRYDFLLALTDRMGGIGLEHHRSSENSRNPEYFTGWSRTNTPTPGTASSGARPTCGRQTTPRRCGATCFGSMRARPSTGVTCCLPAPVFGQSRTPSAPWPRSPQPIRAGSAASGGTRPTPPSIR
jgi:hypothetical protein